jgi:phospholipase/carboxylesterase
MSNTALLPAVQLETGPNPTAAVIWLHGLGADGNDFAPIVPELDLQGLGPVRFIFPHAPQIPVTINGGHVMPAWYDIIALGGARVEDDVGIRRSAASLEALIADQKAQGIPSKRIVLAGFSQGCAMVLHTGLRHAEPLAGIMALSGYLPLAGSVITERSTANMQTPIFMAHGIADPMIALDRAEASCKALQDLGCKVQWHTYQMPHSVHPREIADMAAFLRQVLG